MAQIDNILYTSDFEETTNPYLLNTLQNNDIEVEDDIFNDILDEFSQKELLVIISGIYNFPRQEMYWKKGNHARTDFN
ncbi:hypothetical protein BB558_006319 [Smittium angustum]|uniref:Uncharacterized protein n=1 Tax=Smittium angustum TaxID=133377 RepID=A0A2U1IY21_SMIAN|nr:hypothetical protein BB558_006319 [Smittium angustum]